MEDILTSLIADGRVATRPYNYFVETETLVADFEQMYASINYYLRTWSTANTAATEEQLTGDCQAYTDLILAQFYNKLRSTLERRSPVKRIALMNPRCPISRTLEFPRWISSTLSRIGPIRITGQQFVYVCPPDTHDNYGRAEKPALCIPRYERLHRGLVAAGVHMAPFDFDHDRGSFFTTNAVLNDGAGSWNVYGTVHGSHYENEDVARAIFFAQDTPTAFPDLSIVSGVPNAVTAASAGIPAFYVNRLGIQPAVAATGNTPERYFTCTLGVNITVLEGINMSYQKAFARANT